MDRLNTSEEYAQAAANWEGDFAFIVEGETDIYLYMDLWHGRCRAAYLLEDPNNPKPAFTLATSKALWQEVLTGQLDPIKGIMRRKLKLTGNKIKVLQAPKAATAMVNAAKDIPTDWG